MECRTRWRLVNQGESKENDARDDVVGHHFVAAIILAYSDIHTDSTSVDRNALLPNLRL